MAKVYVLSDLDGLFSTLGGPSPHLAGISLEKAADIAGVLGVSAQSWDEVERFFSSTIVSPLSQDETERVLEILNTPDPDPAPAVDPDPDPDPVPARKSSNWTLWVLGAVSLVCALIFFVVIGKFFLSLPDKSSEIVPAATPTVQVITAAVVQPTPVAPTAVPVQPTPVAPIAAPVQPTAVPVQPTPVVAAPAAPAEVVFDGTTVTADFKGGLPGYLDLRVANRMPGDESMYKINLVADFARIGVLRLVCDDLCIVATYYPSATAQGIDLLPLLKMGKVDTKIPGDQELRAYMKAHGVNVTEGEILDQNYATVFLGSVKASDGAFIIIRMKDDPTKQVNNGGLISFSSDTEPFTVNLDGSVVANPTFILEP